jgi:hypothetical protein
MMDIFQKSGRWRKDGSPHPRPGAQPREGGEARPKVELVVGDFNDPASLKPAFAGVDEAFVVMNGKDLNRLEASALDRSRAFKRVRLRWPQRERGIAEDVRASILGKRSREYMCLSGKGAFISAACHVERARGSRAERPQ